MVERGGRVRAYVVKDRTAPTLIGQVTEQVMPAATRCGRPFGAYGTGGGAAPRRPGSARTF
jgi:hypothetical protein